MQSLKKFKCTLGSQMYVKKIKMRSWKPLVTGAAGHGGLPTSQGAALSKQKPCITPNFESKTGRKEALPMGQRWRAPGLCSVGASPHLAHLAESLVPLEAEPAVVRKTPPMGPWAISAKRRKGATVAKPESPEGPGRSGRGGRGSLHPPESCPPPRVARALCMAHQGQPRSGQTFSRPGGETPDPREGVPRLRTAGGWHLCASKAIPNPAARTPTLPQGGPQQ